jgi:hypothetical protein
MMPGRERLSNKQRFVLLQLQAGKDSKGQQVLEQLKARVLEKESDFEILQTPLLVRNLAKGDVIAISPHSQDAYTLIQRSGNLAIRVFSKTSLDKLELLLTPEVEKLDGSLDLKTTRALSYSLHVNLGFAVIEALFDNVMASFADTVWYYGNVYDPQDGLTPLNWWDSFINQI